MGGPSGVDVLLWTLPLTFKFVFTSTATTSVPPGMFLAMRILPKPDYSIPLLLVSLYLCLCPCLCDTQDPVVLEHYRDVGL